MSSDDFKRAVSQNILNLVARGALQTPITAFELLAKLISLQPVSGSNKAFRLTDIRKLVAIIDELSVSWEAGSISAVRDGSNLTIVQISPNTNQSTSSTNKKRKRLVDEDADSAEEEEALKSAVSTKSKSASTSLNSLSKDLQEIYALLRRGTARQKLLCEQVRVLRHLVLNNIHDYF